MLVKQPKDVHDRLVAIGHAHGMHVSHNVGSSPLQSIIDEVKTAASLLTASRLLSFLLSDDEKDRVLESFTRMREAEKTPGSGTDEEREFRDLRILCEQQYTTLCVLSYLDGYSDGIRERTSKMQMGWRADEWTQGMISDAQSQVSRLFDDLLNNTTWDPK